ncbi:MAG: CPBP family intramembrane metalloprotease, partial [Candidatus Nanopelagicales bacterium]|nr:CPBP family intramembrane metalloprotease [Candidatus Nanopelagicales bacterium]
SGASMTPEHPVAVVVGLFVAYMLVVGVLWKVTGTRYDALADSRAHVVRGIILPIGVGALLLAIATTWLGWWDLALFGDGRFGPTWALIVPAIMAVVVVANIVTIDFRSPKADVIPFLVIGTLLVGFSEELLSRGLLVVGLRQGGASELVVWLATSTLFALLHAMNALFGQSVKMTVTQIVFAFVAGTAFYVTFMTTGSLLVAMILHALWDLGALGIKATGAQQKPAIGLLAFGSYAAALVSVWFVIGVL